MSQLPYSSSLLLISPIVLLICICIYRLRFDPLSKFPGSKLAAVTRTFFEGYYDYYLGGQYTFKIGEMHKKYGLIIRISPYELHINDPEFFDVLYRQTGRWNKYSFPYLSFGLDGTVGATSDHDQHKQRRIAMNALFAKSSVAASGPMILHSVEKLSRCIDKYADSGETMNLGVALSALTADLATEFLLGKNWGVLDREDFSDWATDFSNEWFSAWQGNKHVPGYRLYSRARILLRWLMGNESAKTFVQWRTGILARGRELHALHYTSTKKQTSMNLVSQILSSVNLDNADKTPDRLDDEIVTVVGVAVETTAQTLRALVYWLYSSPELLQNLRHELAIQIDPADPWNNRNFEQMPYLNAVILETLRLNPGIVTRGARIAPDRELVYKDWVIPAGTPVGMTIWLLHHDEQLYPDPFKFKPSRWLDPETGRLVQSNTVFAPFSKGTRSCVGMSLAWAELYPSLVMLVTRFDFTFDGTKASDVETGADYFGMVPKTNNGVKVKVKRRMRADSRK